MSESLLDLVRELNALNDDNLSERVIKDSDVQWCLSELQDILEAKTPTLTSSPAGGRGGHPMTRSTHKDERGYYLTGDGIYVDEDDPAKFRGADVDRLAAHEDTGLEPEDVIEEWYGRWEKRRSAMKRMTFDGNFCDIAMCGEVRGGSFCENGSCSQREVWERLKALEDILGGEYDLERLRKLIQEDREGRLVVLPCKVGDIVYEIRYSAENGDTRKYARKKFDHSLAGRARMMRTCPNSCYVSEKKCTKNDFSFMGRTVFLTREEAEAALRREQDG